jgi:histidyl-tRNA synthetase
MGMERLLLLIETLGKVPAELSRQVDVYLVTLGEGTQQAALRLAEQLRDALPDVRLVVHCGGGSFKSQFKKADKSGALFALILGEAEAAAGQVGVKPLREDGEQANLAWTEVPQYLRNLLQEC